MPEHPDVATGLQLGAKLSRYSSRLLAACCIAGALALYGCGSAEGPPKPAAATAPSQPVPQFSDVSVKTGLVFKHINGFDGSYRFPEIAGSGGALFDYDNDGDLDIYLVQGNYLAGNSEEQPENRLFRNDLDSTNDDGGVGLLSQKKCVMRRLDPPRINPLCRISLHLKLPTGGYSFIA